MRSKNFRVVENIVVESKPRSRAEIRTGKQTQKKQRRFTNVWMKQNGAWKIVAEHSSVLAPAKFLPRRPLADKMARK